MKDKPTKVKKQVVNEILGSMEYDDMSEKQPNNRGTYTKPMILKNMTESFDHFRQGMDKLANVYMLMQAVDPELHRKMSRFGDTMSKMLDGYAKIIQQEGGSVNNPTKSDGLQKYFGSQGMSALGMNENKEEIFKTRVDLHIGRIKSIMENTKH